MKRKKQSITIELTAEQGKRLRALGRRLWPEDKLELDDICRWLVLGLSHLERDRLEQLRLLLAEAERAVVTEEV